MDVEQLRERMSPIGVVAGDLILSGILSFFLLFLIHIYAAIFFLVFLMTFMVYFRYEHKLKPGVSVVMSATPSQKVYGLGDPKGSYEEKRYRLAAASPAPFSLGFMGKGLKFINPSAIIDGANNLGSDLHIKLMKKTIEKLHEDNMLVVAPKESDAPDLIAYPVASAIKKKYMWDDKNRRAYEIQTNAREDSVLANANKKQKYNIPITWITYDESILEEIQKITEDKDGYLLTKM